MRINLVELYLRSPRSSRRREHDQDLQVFGDGVKTVLHRFIHVDHGSGFDGTVFVAHSNHPLALNHIIYFVLGVGLLRVGFSRLQDVKPEAES
tara:strand:+ start:541 stop:819 length:279 start_codon:yes stop_codon:yes gene_type:complete